MIANTQTTRPSYDSIALRRRDFLANTAVGLAGLVAVGPAHAASEPPRGTVRSWIQSGALRSSRPGNGTQPGRTYRIRREDLEAFVAASEGRLALPGGPSAMPPCSVGKSDGSPRGGDEVT